MELFEDEDDIFVNNNPYFLAIPLHCLKIMSFIYNVFRTTLFVKIWGTLVHVTNLVRRLEVVLSHITMAPWYRILTEFTTAFLYLYFCVALCIQCSNNAMFFTTQITLEQWYILNREMILCKLPKCSVEMSCKWI